eukprot:6143389-Pyramimonas_sp.AAC.1
MASTCLSRSLDGRRVCPRGQRAGASDGPPMAADIGCQSYPITYMSDKVNIHMGHSPPLKTSRGRPPLSPSM